MTLVLSSNSFSHVYTLIYKCVFLPLLTQSKHGDS